MKNTCRKGNCTYCHHPLFHDDEIDTTEAAAQKKKRRQMNVEPKEKPTENTPASDSASITCRARQNTLVFCSLELECKRFFIRKKRGDEFGIFRLTEHVIVATFG
ncbi:hypothetical protein T10_10016 [Trichinella papuae]|uniref:Uncharacterized protein n=1 Tax=Trichinella papuae TaxID=268474 RepID=A0A0V1N3X8_9BILA|nr:hypothetical protein T10_10016 [Trichinella papuae]